MRSRTALVFVIACALAAPAAAITFRVNSSSTPGDATPGDGACATGLLVDLGAGPMPECTLRAAIEEANGLPGIDVIEFDPALPPNDGAFVRIAVGAPLVVSDPIALDGATASGYDTGDPFATPIVELDGTNGTGAAFVLATGAAGSAIEALAIHGFPGPAFDVAASGVRIEACHLGLRGSGEVDGNGYGVRAGFGTGGLVVERNVIAGSVSHGIDTRGAIVASRNRIGTARDGLSSQSGGASTGNLGHGLYMADGGIVDDNVISGSGGRGVFAEGDGPGGPLEITRNRIGTDETGELDLGNGSHGVALTEGVDGGLVRDNVISGNGGDGVALISGGGGGGPSNALVDDNRIGVSASEDAVLPNGGAGVRIAPSAFTAEVRANLIGGNLGSGVDLDGGFSTHRIVGNWIGTNALGANLGNRLNGVETLTGGVRIGGPGEGNVIGHNLQSGIAVQGDAILTSIRGNYVGTDASGANLGNRGHGIRLAYDSEVGGSLPRDGNVIGWNWQDGIHVTGDDNEIAGNWIGTNERFEDIGNGDDGIEVEALALSGASSNDNAIGSRASTPVAELAERANRIAWNGDDGIALGPNLTTFATVMRNSLRGNSSFQNGGLGTDLAPDGANGSDPGDGDSGTNKLQNAPQLDPNGTQATPTGQLEVRYRVDTSSLFASYPITVDFYLADGPPLSEGRVFLGTDTYTQAKQGLFETRTVFPAPGTVVQGRVVAMATDAQGNSSEWSASVPVGAQSPCGDLDVSGNVDPSDAWTYRDFLAGTPLPTGGPERCKVVADGGPCSLLDAVIVRRFAIGPALVPGIAQACAAAP